MASLFIRYCPYSGLQCPVLMQVTCHAGRYRSRGTLMLDSRVLRHQELDERRKQLSLSRLNHWLPRGQTHTEVMERTTDFHHEIADALLPQADPVFDDATAFDTPV